MTPSRPCSDWGQGGHRHCILVCHVTSVLCEVTKSPWRAMWTEETSFCHLSSVLTEFRFGKNVLDRTKSNYGYRIFRRTWFVCVSVSLPLSVFICHLLQLSVHHLHVCLSLSSSVALWVKWFTRINRTSNLGCRKVEEVDTCRQL